MKTALSIAGSDSCAGAGIQADMKTMLANGVYATCAVTAVTAQNTTGVFDVQAMPPGLLEKQIDAVFADIPPDAVKIGMLANADLVRVTAERLAHYCAQNVVADPVMVSTSGRALLEDAAIDTLTSALFPRVTLITPNIPEAERLTGRAVHSRDEMADAAKRLADAYGVSVLVKGGHAPWGPDDVLASADDCIVFRSTHIDAPETHGTGCALSSAIAANLAKGASLEDAIRRAKDYVTGAIAHPTGLGHGAAMMDFYYLFEGEN